MSEMPQRWCVQGGPRQGVGRGSYQFVYTGARLLDAQEAGVGALGEGNVVPCRLAKRLGGLRRVEDVVRNLKGEAQGIASAFECRDSARGSACCDAAHREGRSDQGAGL